MFRACFYKKPFLTALSFLLLGFGLLLAGILLEAGTRSMDYYAMAAFGVFFLTAGLVTFAVYLRMEKEYRKTAGGRPLLRYTVGGQELQKGVKRQEKELRAQNRGLLTVMLFFCVLFGVVLPFFVEEGRIMVYICAGLAVFLILAERIITSYRVRKLHGSTGEYILTPNGVFSGSDFHAWNVPGTALTGADYTPAAEEEETGTLTVTYTAAGLAGPQKEKVLLPIPKALEKEIPKVLAALRRGTEVPADGGGNRRPGGTAAAKPDVREHRTRPPHHRSGL